MLLIWKFHPSDSGMVLVIFSAWVQSVFVIFFKQFGPLEEYIRSPADKGGNACKALA